MLMASSSEELRKRLGVSAKEAERLRSSILGRYPALRPPLQRISPSKDGGVRGAKIAQVIMDDVKPVDVNVLATIDYASVERSIYEKMIESMGVSKDVLLAGRRGGKMRSLRRAVVEGSGVEPKAASWYPLTDDEVETEYDTMVAEGRVKVSHDGVSFSLINHVHDEILVNYSEADAEATLRLHERLRDLDDEPG